MISVSLCRLLFVDETTVDNSWIFNKKQSIIRDILYFSSGAA